ncbi:hypothetical protein GmHk_19G054489 [Glycine max]|nr:hypothetical protein GmHk_19G054489 [Glycine max]
MRAKTKIMSEIEEVQEQMKVDMEAMKEKMMTMMDMRKIMEVNTAVAAATSTTTERDPTHQPVFNQESHLVTDVEGQGGVTGEEAQEAPIDHTITGFEPHPRYTIEGHAAFGIPTLNTPGASQHHMLSQPLHFVRGEGPPVVFKKEKIEHMEDRWRDLAAQVVPPMAEREMITMIMDTLSVFYYEKMIGYMPLSFADLVFPGERIEAGLRKGKFNYVASMNPSNEGLERSGERKKEGEPHVVAAMPTWPNFPLAPYNPMYQYPPRQYHYSANVNPAHYPPPYQPKTPGQPQRPPLNRPQHPPAAHPRPNTTPNTNQNTNQGRNFP